MERDKMNALSAPIYMGIDLTERCNLRCVHCRVSTSKEKSNEIPLKKVKQLIDELSKLKVIQIIFSGGEPFIRKDIFEILSYAVKKGIPDIIIVSNGLLLNKEKIEKLKQTRVKKITISLDGLRNSHDEIRGKGTFDKTVKVIKNLIKNNFQVQVTITMNKLNKKDVPKLSMFLKKLGVKKVNAGNLMPCGRGKELWYQSLDIDEKKDLFNKTKKVNKKCGKNFVSFESSFLSEPTITSSEKNIISFLGCRGGRIYCAVLANGNVVACKMLPYIIAGNIYKKSLKNIWKDNKNWKIWRSDNLPKKCQHCKYGYACRGGCKAISFYEYGKTDLPDSRCLGPFT